MILPNPGEFGLVFQADAVSAWRAFLSSALRSGPGGRLAACSRIFFDHAASLSWRDVVCLKRRRWGIGMGSTRSGEKNGPEPSGGESTAPGPFLMAFLVMRRFNCQVHVRFLFLNPKYLALASLASGPPTQSRRRHKHPQGLPHAEPVTRCRPSPDRAEAVGMQSAPDMPARAILRGPDG
jgi:hypothetical protein